MPAHTFDLTRGLYRRIYDGFRTGKRINSVSVDAEALFWRLMVSADDFGNMQGDPMLVKAVAARKRAWSESQIRKLIAELESVNLVATYTVEDEPYIHIVGFTDTQPANKNGRRVQRCPQPLGNPRESKGIQGNPVKPGLNIRNEPWESGGTQASDTDTDTDTDTESEDDSKRKRGAATPPRSPSADAEEKPEATPSDLDSVVTYGKSIRLGSGECEKFYDHFSANGWKQGGKTAMKDWQAALRNWKRRAKDFGGEPDATPVRTDEEWDRLITEAWEQDNGPDLVRRAKEQAAREQAAKDKGENL